VACGRRRNTKRERDGDNAHHSIIRRHRRRRGYRGGLLRVFNIVTIIIVRRVNNDCALISVCSARYTFRLGRLVIQFVLKSARATSVHLPVLYIIIYIIHSYGYFFQYPLQRRFAILTIVNIH